MKKILTYIFSALLLLPMLGVSGCSCGSEPTNVYKPISNLDTTKNITLEIAVEKDDLGLNKVANKFMKKYNNVDVIINLVQNYTTNSKNMIKENRIDIAFSEGITYDSTTDNYFYDFATDTEIDFSHVNSDIFNNFKYKTGNREYQYSLPLGGDLRGLFVNKSLLKKYNLSVPTNYSEFLNCCETLKNENYIPIQGNPGYACVNFGIGDVVKNIVNNNESYEKLKNASENVSELFTDTYGKMYELATKRYYDYKTVETTLGLFKSTSSEQLIAEEVLGVTNSNRRNEFGDVAFFPYISALTTYFNKVIKENNLSTEYTFIATPLNDENEKPAYYVTPSLALYANKNSENLVWIREFVNFLFYPENNYLYAENSGIIPNTKDSSNFLAQKYNTTPESCIFCGKILFENYNAYTPIRQSILEPFKCSAEKYMVKLEKNADEEIVYRNDGDGLGDYLRLADNDKVKLYYLSNLSNELNAGDGLGSYYSNLGKISQIKYNTLKKENNQLKIFNDASGDYILSGGTTKIYLKSIITLKNDDDGEGCYYTQTIGDVSSKIYVTALKKENNIVKIYNDANGEYFISGTDTKVYLANLLILMNASDSENAYFEKETKIYASTLNKNTEGLIVYNDSNGNYYICDTAKVYKNDIGQEDPSKTGFAFCTLQYYIKKTEKVFSEYRNNGASN